MSIFDYEPIVYKIASHCNIFEQEALLLSSQTCYKVINGCVEWLAAKYYICTKDFLCYKRIYCDWYYCTKIKDARLLERELLRSENTGSYSRNTSYVSTMFYKRLLDSFVSHIDLFNRRLPDITELRLVHWLKDASFNDICCMATNIDPNVFYTAIITSGKEDLIKHFWNEIRKGNREALLRTAAESTLRVFYTLCQKFPLNKSMFPTALRIRKHCSGNYWSLIRGMGSQGCVFNANYELQGFSATISSHTIQPATDEQKEQFQKGVAVNFIKQPTAEETELIFQDPPEEWLQGQKCNIAFFRSGRYDLMQTTKSNMLYSSYIDLDENRSGIDWLIKQHNYVPCLETPSLISYMYTHHNVEELQFHSNIDLNIQLQSFDKSDAEKNTELIFEYCCYSGWKVDHVYMLFDSLDADYEYLFVKLLNETQYDVCKLLLQKGKVDKAVVLERLVDNPLLELFRMLLE